MYSSDQWGNNCGVYLRDTSVVHLSLSSNLTYFLTPWVSSHSGFWDLYTGVVLVSSVEDGNL